MACKCTRGIAMKEVKLFDVQREKCPLLSFLISGMVLLTCCTNPKADDHAIILRLGHNTPSGHPYDLAAHKFADGVEMATNGQVRIKIYPSSQLGDTGDQLEGLLLGTLDFSIAATSFASEFIPELGLFSTPFLFDGVEHFGNVFDGKVGKMLDSLALLRYKISFIGALSSGDRAFFNSERAIENVDDLKGLKVRVMSGRADALTWEAFGAIPTPMPYSEVYSALQAGVIDGAENDPASILNNRFYETCPYLSLTNHLVLPMGIFASQRMLRRLSEEQREAVLHQAHLSGVWQRHFMEHQNSNAIATMRKDFGVKVSHPDRKEFLEKVRTLQDEVAKELNAQDILKQIRKEKTGRDK